jgi:hypothetical protein
VLRIELHGEKSEPLEPPWASACRPAPIMDGGGLTLTRACRRRCLDRPPWAQTPCTQATPTVGTANSAGTAHCAGRVPSVHGHHRRVPPAPHFAPPALRTFAPPARLTARWIGAGRRGSVIGVKYEFSKPEGARPSYCDMAHGAAGGTYSHPPTRYTIRWPLWHTHGSCRWRTCRRRVNPGARQLGLPLRVRSRDRDVILVFLYVACCI